MKILTEFSSPPVKAFLLLVCAHNNYYPQLLLLQNVPPIIHNYHYYPQLLFLQYVPPIIHNFHYYPQLLSSQYVPPIIHNFHYYPQLSFLQYVPPIIHNGQNPFPRNKLPLLAIRCGFHILSAQCTPSAKSPSAQCTPCKASGIEPTPLHQKCQVTFLLGKHYHRNPQSDWGRLEHDVPLLCAQRLTTWRRYDDRCCQGNIRLSHLQFSQISFNSCLLQGDHRQSLLLHLLERAVWRL